MGSEIPDSHVIVWYEGGTNYGGYSVSIKTSCDNWVENDVIGADHSVKFPNPTGDPLAVEHFNLQKNIVTAQTYILNGFLLKDCQYTAYYMGALAHLIGDAAYYPHLLRGWDGWEDENRDSRYAVCVNFLTNTIYPHRTALDFFNIFEARSEFDQNDLIAPSEAAYLACIDTRYGNNVEDFNGWVNTEYMDATELHDAYVNTCPWPENSKECELWTKTTRAYLEGQHLSWANYFWTIEHNLNTVIYYLASTLNYLLYMNFESCDCTGEIGEDGILHYIQQQEAEWVANEQGPWTKEWLVKYELANIMSLFGLVMALITVSVVKRLDILVVV